MLAEIESNSGVGRIRNNANPGVRVRVDVVNDEIVYDAHRELVGLFQLGTTDGCRFVYDEHEVCRCSAAPEAAHL